MADAKSKTDTEGTDDAPRDPDQIEREIEETRAEMAETVAAVADKADVKKQAKAKVEETKSNVKAKVSSAKESAQEKAGSLGSSGSEAGEGPGAQEQAQEYVDQARSYASENPLHSAAAGALLAGFVLGWLWGRRG